MINRKLFSPLLLSLFVTLTSTACVSNGSSSVTYHLLDPQPGTTYPTNTSIGIGPIEIPDHLDRPHLLTRRGDGSLHASKLHRWASPFDSVVSHSIQQNIALRFPAADVSVYPWTANRRVSRQIIISLHQFIADGKRVQLTGQWRLFNRNGRLLGSKRFNISTAVSANGASDKITAMAKAVALLSDQLAASVR